MLSQEEIFEKPTLYRSNTIMYSPPPLVRSDTQDTRMDIDELETTLPTWSKPPLVRSHTLQNGENLFKTTTDSRPDNGFYQPEKLRRETSSDYGIFDENFEHDLYNWFTFCSNEKKAEYIKYLTDHMLYNNTEKVQLKRQDTCIESTEPVSSVNQPRLGKQDRHTLNTILNEPELESIFNSKNNGYTNPPVLSRVLGTTPGEFEAMYTNTKSPVNFTEQYSDDEFEENDPNEITMRHGDFKNAITVETDTQENMEIK